MKVAICTWNAAQTLHKKQSLRISTWLDIGGDGDDLTKDVDRMPGSSSPSESDDGPPRLYAIGIQESVPLPGALLGSQVAQLVPFEQDIRDEITKHALTWGRKEDKEKPDTEFVLVRKVVMGAIALFLYADQDMAGLISDVSQASVGCGPLFMSNKGAVGIRFSMTYSDRETTWTFLTAHLAAHDYNVERRNLDWQNIVTRLLFQTNDAVDRYKQVYDSDYLFVCGDLNYRIDTTRTSPSSSLTSQRLSEDLEAKNTANLLKYDQLRRQLAKNKTLHGLSEGTIDFLPTYKYKVGTDTYKPFEHRTPSYCDRILHASTDDTLDVLSYRSVSAVQTSDHKPVTALYRVASQAHRRPSQPKALSSPFAPDASFQLKQTIGYAMDKLVGSVWSLAIIAGFGNDKLGALVLLLSIAAALLAARRCGRVTDVFGSLTSGLLGAATDAAKTK